MNRRNLLGCLLAAPMVPFLSIESTRPYEYKWTWTENPMFPIRRVDGTARIYDPRVTNAFEAQRHAEILLRKSRNPALVAAEHMDNAGLPVNWETVARDAIYLEQPVDP